MIQSFRCKETENLFQGIRSHRLPNDIQRVAMRKLTYLNSVVDLNALRVPPGNRLEALRNGDQREGQYSIRINDQWRICFEWHNDGPYMVEIVDYH